MKVASLEDYFLVDQLSYWSSHMSLISRRCLAYQFKAVRGTFQNIYEIRTTESIIVFQVTQLHPVVPNTSLADHWPVIETQTTNY